MRTLKFKALFERFADEKKEWITSTLKEELFTIPLGYKILSPWFQYVGKEDKNNLPIFEGDIFAFEFIDPVDNEHHNLIGTFSFGSDLSFEIDVYNNPTYTCLHYIDDGRFNDFEIIGNTITNPISFKKKSYFLKENKTRN